MQCQALQDKYLGLGLGSIWHLKINIQDLAEAVLDLQDKYLVLGRGSDWHLKRNIQDFPKAELAL